MLKKRHKNKYEAIAVGYWFIY